MPDILSAAIEYSHYISPIKLGVFTLLFFAWMPLVNWVFGDTQAVKTKTKFWTGLTMVTAFRNRLLKRSCKAFLKKSVIIFFRSG